MHLLGEACSKSWLVLLLINESSKTSVQGTTTWFTFGIAARLRNRKEFRSLSGTGTKIERLNETRGNLGIDYHHMGGRYLVTPSCWMGH